MLLNCGVGEDSCTVKDAGCGIEDVEQARQPLYTTGGEERSGMGITIMESFMNELRIKSTLGKGTSVRMRKRIISRREPACAQSS